MKRFNPKPGFLWGYFNVGGREPWQDHCLQIPGSLIDLRGPQYICFFAGDDVPWHFFSGGKFGSKKRRCLEKNPRDVRFEACWEVPHSSRVLQGLALNKSCRYVFGILFVQVRPADWRRFEWKFGDVKICGLCGSRPISWIIPNDLP